MARFTTGYFLTGPLAILLVACGGGGGDSSPTPTANLVMGLAENDYSKIINKSHPNDGQVDLGDLAKGGLGVPQDAAAQNCKTIEFFDNDGNGELDFAKITINNCVDQSDQEIHNGYVTIESFQDLQQILSLLGTGCPQVFDFSQLENPNRGAQIIVELRTQEVNPTNFETVSGTLNFVVFPLSKIAALKGKVVFGELMLEDGRPVIGIVQYCLKVEVSDSGVVVTGKIVIEVYTEKTDDLLLKIVGFLQPDGSISFRILDHLDSDQGVEGFYDHLTEQVIIQ